MKVNPVLLEVFKNKFSSIAEEMGVTLTRTSFSSNIKERRDLSCAIFNKDGKMVAQAAHIPVHLGSMPLAVQAAIKGLELQEGDMVISNDPFAGGTHLPDVTLVAPVFDSSSEDPVFYVANRAHHSDIGGMSSGSMPLSTSLYQEGIIIPPLKILRRGELDSDLMSLILRNVRTPEEQQGDFAAQIMANKTGIQRLKELFDQYDLSTALFYAQSLMDYSETMIRKTIEQIPNGVYSYQEVMDDDGIGAQNIPVYLNLTVQNQEAILDFSQTADQVQGSINAVKSITISAVLYVFRALVGRDIPTNDGCLRPLKVITRPGSLLDAKFPAAVAGGNVETSQRIVDVILGALAQAIPDKIPAASQGTMNNITIGGTDPWTKTTFSYYETLAGGTGASKWGPGEDAVHSHMTNTLNTPIEALESSYPIRMIRYVICPHTGGEGKHRGGNGLIRELEMLSSGEVTVLSERRRNRPYGLQGGQPGSPGKNFIWRKGEYIAKPGKFRENLQNGDRLCIQTPGGGGYGQKD